MLNSMNIYGPINNLGYGIFTRGMIKGLADLGIFNFSINPIGPVQVPDDEDEKHRLQAISESIMWERAAPSLAIWHEFDLNKFSGSKLISYPIFETTKLRERARNQLKQMDSIIVPSNWAKNIIENNIGTDVPVYVVPGAANLPVLSEKDAVSKNKHAFTFINVGKFEKRKSHLELLKAYGQAFKDIPDTRLILHCINPHTQNFENSISQVLTSIGYKVEVHSTDRYNITASFGKALVSIPRQRLSTIDLFRLYNYSHVGVFPSRGEGWNLPLIESIQTGLPCIATDYSAHTEYLNETTEYPEELLIKDFTMSPANDGMYFQGDLGEWANISVDSIANKMLFTYKNYDNLAAKTETSIKKIRNTYTWENSAQLLFNIVTR